MSVNVLDVETSPDREKALHLMPPFSPAEVRVGNLRDQTKINEKIEEARASHQSDWLDKAALRPETAQVLAIGIYSDKFGYKGLNTLNCGTEKDLLNTFWQKFTHWHTQTGHQWAGWNLFGFDMSMLILRSHFTGASVPGGLRKGRYYDPVRLRDLRDDFLMGRNPMEFKSSLGYVSRAFGLEGKDGDGKDFAEVYATNPTAAMKYLLKDVFLTRAVAEKLGFSMSPANESWEQFQARFPVEKPLENKPAEELF